MCKNSSFLTQRASSGKIIEIVNGKNFGAIALTLISELLQTSDVDYLHGDQAIATEPSCCFHGNRNLEIECGLFN